MTNKIIRLYCPHCTEEVAIVGKSILFGTITGYCSNCKIEIVFHVMKQEG